MFSKHGIILHFAVEDLYAYRCSCCLADCCIIHCGLLSLLCVGFVAEENCMIVGMQCCHRCITTYPTSICGQVSSSQSKPMVTKMKFEREVIIQLLLMWDGYRSNTIIMSCTTSFLYKSFFYQNLRFCCILYKFLCFCGRTSVIEQADLFYLYLSRWIHQRGSRRQFFNVLRVEV